MSNPNPLQKISSVVMENLKILDSLNSITTLVEDFPDQLGQLHETSEPVFDQASLLSDEILKQLDTLKALFLDNSSAPSEPNSRLATAVENLVQQLQTYESDTFSASRTGIDSSTAQQMAAHLIYAFLFNSEGYPGNCIDGAVVGDAFDAVTETEVIDSEFDLD